MKLIALTIAVVCVCSAPAAAQQAAPPPPEVAYETFCAMSRMEKQQARQAMNAEQRTKMWQTQIERWRDANRARLNAGQLALIDEFHKMVPVTFVRPRTPENDARMESLELRLTGAFTEGDMKGMDNYGPCIAKVK